jgi:serine/threonine-protein kinase
LNASSTRHFPVHKGDFVIDVRFLGAIEVRSSGLEGSRIELTQPKRLALLAYLALAEPTGLHARDRVLALLWPDADQASARHSLRNALHALRQALGDNAIQTRGESWVGLGADAVRCDVLEVRAHLAGGRLQEALAVCSGELMPGFHISGAPDFDHWLEEQRVALSRAIRTAAWNRAQQLEGAGSELEAVRQAARLDPGNERGTRRLMELLAAAGDRGGALRAYQDVVDWFSHELESQPSSETRALAERLRASGAADRSAPTRAPSANQSADAPALVRPIRMETTLPRGMRRAVIAVGLLGIGALGVGLYRMRGEGGRTNPGTEAELAARRLPARYHADTAGYSSYLRGLTLRFQNRLVESRDTLATLVDREPLYVPGLHGLANAWILTALAELTDPNEAWPKADALARRALDLDSTAASAWLALAAEDFHVHVDLPRAGERINHARQLDPSDPEVAAVRSVWFRNYGEMDSAVVEARLAHRLDPLSLGYERLLANQLFYARRYEESLKAYQRLQDDEPASARGYLDLARLCVAMDRKRDAVRWLRDARVAQRDSAGAAMLADAPTESAAAGLLAANARRTIAQLDSGVRAGKRVPPLTYAFAFAALRDTGATLRWLDSTAARRNNDKHLVRVDPTFDFLRADSRYRAWLLRTALPTMR